MKEPIKTGEIKVVEAREVSALTLQGYHLVDRYQETVTEVCFDNAPDPNAGYPNAMLSLSKNVPVTRTCFVMAQEEGSTIASLSRKLTNEIDEAKEIRNKVKQAESNVSELKAALRDAEERLRLYREETDRRDKKQKDMERRLQQMEADLGKIREEIGSAKMREIIRES